MVSIAPAGNYSRFRSIQKKLISSFVLLIPLFIVLTIPDTAHATTMTSPGYQINGSVISSGSSSRVSPAFRTDGDSVGQSIFIPSSEGSPNYKNEQLALESLGKSRLKIRMGDINDDGRVDISDALMALKISVGLIPMDNKYLANGDVAPFIGGKSQPDGKINISDALIILKKCVGLVNW